MASERRPSGNPSLGSACYRGTDPRARGCYGNHGPEFGTAPRGHQRSHCLGRMGVAQASVTSVRNNKQEERVG